MKDKNTTTQFFGGLPTKPDVDKLMPLLDKYKESETIPYQDTEAAINEVRSTNRWRTVVEQWRKRARRDRNIYLLCVAGEGFLIANPKDIVSTGARGVKKHSRGIVRASAIAAMADVNRLDEQDRKLREHVITIPARLRLAELTAPKQLTA